MLSTQELHARRGANVCLLALTSMAGAGYTKCIYDWCVQIRCWQASVGAQNLSAAAAFSALVLACTPFKIYTWISLWMRHEGLPSMCLRTRVFERGPRGLILL